MKQNNFVPKKIILAAGILFFYLNLHAQLVNAGGTITIESGAIVYTKSDITNSTNGIITNEGKIISAGSFINVPNASLSGNGIYSVQGNFTNTGTYNQDNSLLEFYGTGNSNLKNTNGSVYILQLNKAPNSFVNLKGNAGVINSVIFLADQNWIKLGKNTLTLRSNASVQGFSNKRFFITNGAGLLRKNKIGTTAFTFPVGFTKNTYNAISITENGTTDDYSVQALEHALLQGSTGNPISSGGIDAGWFISEATPGNGNAVIEANWKNTDELLNFDKTKCMVVRYNGTKWDYKPAQAGAATGNLYRFISRSGLSSFGNFTVLSVTNPTIIENQFISGNKPVLMMDNAETVIKVYPTIVQHVVNVEVQSGLKNIQKMDVNIVDVNGKMVYQKTGTSFNSQQIILPNLAQGVYFVHILYGTEKFVQKIIVSM